MATFPGGIVSLTNPTSGDSLDTAGVVHSVQHAAVNDEVEAIETELGTNPSGSESTVAARFTANESAASTLAGRVTTAEGDITALEADVAALPGGDVRVFDAVAYGAVVNGSTNDTAAWQAAIDACAAAGGGVVTSSKNGVSVISGALQDTGAANAQLVLPSVHVTSGEQISISIRGLTPPPADVSVIGSMVLPDNHLVLKSTLSSGTGAVIGVKGPSGSPSGFSNVHVEVSRLSLRMPSNPTNSGLDLRYAATAHVEEFIADVGTYDSSAVTEPTTTTSFAVRMPTNNNGARATLRHVNVVGFYNGVEHSEHAVLTNVNAWGCKVAYVPTAANHASTYLRVGYYHCERGIKPTAAHSLDAWQLNAEHAASGWMTTDYDIDDASNYLTGFVRWWSVLAGVGPHNSFTVNGGSSATTSRVGAAIGSGGGTTEYTHRDRLVASSGDTILTLGATPVTNAHQVWVNGSIKWPTTDYTISANVITFLSGLSASDVVAVLYRSTTGTYTAATIAGAAVNIADPFTRADSTSNLGTTPTGSKVWSQLAGTWGIASNKAYVSSGTASTVCVAVVDSGVVNGTLSAVVTNTLGGANAGFAFRVTDALNFYAVDTKVGGATNVALWKVVAGVFTAITIPTTGAFASGDTLAVVLSGSSITLKKNGTTFATVTDSTFTTQTKHGLYIESPSATSSPGRFDDFSIQP